MFSFFAEDLYNEASLNLLLKKVEEVSGELSKLQKKQDSRSLVEEIKETKDYLQQLNNEISFIEKRVKEYDQLTDYVNTRKKLDNLYINSEEKLEQIKTALKKIYHYIHTNPTHSRLSIFNSFFSRS
jgi:RNA polymerase-binding transcription factor DksA